MTRSCARDAAAPTLVVAAAREIALFLDVDGTLLHIADTPDSVTIERDTLQLVGRAHRATGGAVALITGRRIADVDRLFAPLALPVAGQHGFERRGAGGGVQRHAQPAPQLAAVHAELEAFAAHHPGVLIEDKELTIAAHYRLAASAEQPLTALAQRLVAASGGALAIQRGKMVIELRPAGRDKGTAIAEFMDEAPFRGRTPVFLGDDLTDEYGFSIVNGLGGISVKVGDGPTEARARLPDVDAVRAWLERLVAAAGCGVAG
ncbi:MAG TPA: trehalose-phosphatase [Burkholderiales bacterium]|nr:trehalose-phosphatase [Burkholderiales bacterium]